MDRMCYSNISWAVITPETPPPLIIFGNPVRVTGGFLPDFPGGSNILQEACHVYQKPKILIQWTSFGLAEAVSRRADNSLSRVS